MSRVGSSRTDAVAVAWSFPAGTWWGAPGTETPSKAHYLSHEALPIGDHKQSYAAELRQVLADSAETPFALTPAAAEELRRIYRAVTESSGRAKERATALHGYIQKLDKYQNDQKLDKSWKDLVWQQRQLALRFHHEWQMNILGTKPADPLAEFVSTGSTPKQQQEGMSRVGSSRTDANAWSFHAGTSWGAPPTEPLDKYQNDLVWQLQRTRLGFHHRMTFQELRRITDGFSEKRLLGKGGFGMVYKQEQIEEACQRASRVEEVARERQRQMQAELNAHCKIPGPRVKFAQYVDEKMAASSPVSNNCRRQPPL